MAERILTLHPEGKAGVNIEKEKYGIIRDAILALLGKRETMTFRQLTAEVEEHLGDTFDGSVGWYVTTVKLDLEARKEIERLPGSPQRLRIC